MEDLYGMISECCPFLVCITVLKINEWSSSLWNNGPAKIVISNNINKFQRKKYFLTLQIIYLLRQNLLIVG